MNKTPEQLAADIVTFCNYVFEPIGVPVVKQQLKTQRPVELLVGVTIPGVSPVDVLAACNPSALHAAVKPTWPVNMVCGFRDKKIAIAADGQTVIFDFVAYSVNLVTPEDMTRA